MGSGKSAVGRVLARRLRYTFVDTDTIVERRAGKKIPGIVRKKGWLVFRKMESRALRDALARNKVVVATGGGMILDSGNRHFMKKKGMIVHLTARPETILKRVRRKPTRPLLDVANPLKEIRQLLKKRQRFYAMAGMKISTDHKTPAQLATAILLRLRAAH